MFLCVHHGIFVSRNEYHHLNHQCLRVWSSLPSILRISQNIDPGHNTWCRELDDVHPLHPEGSDSKLHLFKFQNVSLRWICAVANLPLSCRILICATVKRHYIKYGHTLHRYRSSSFPIASHSPGTFRHLSLLTYCFSMQFRAEGILHARAAGQDRERHEEQINEGRKQKKRCWIPQPMTGSEAIFTILGYRSGYRWISLRVSLWSLESTFPPHACFQTMEGVQ